MPASLFSSLPTPRPDPIFTMMAQAKAAGPSAIDGTIGIFMDESGKPLLMNCARKAIADVAATLPNLSFSYPPLLGLPEYREAVTALVFPGQSRIVANLSTTGGTGALAINLRLAKLMRDPLKVILPVPAYVNHPPLCVAAGVELVRVPYLADGKPTVEGIVDGVRKEKHPCLVLLQAGCNNPLGLDLSQSQWEELATILAGRGCMVLLDFPYQGFASEPDEDALPARILADHRVTTFIAWSGAKNHSIYSERAGFACTVVPDEPTKALVEAHYSMITRGLHSPSATFGQRVVVRMQRAYRDEWLKELQDARTLLARKRDALKENLPATFRTAIDGHGMFATLPVTREQMAELQSTHKVFLTGDGRINVAGIPMHRIEELSQKICMVVPC